jgi:hypothetical protein
MDIYSGTSCHTNAIEQECDFGPFIYFVGRKKLLFVGHTDKFWIWNWIVQSCVLVLQTNGGSECTVSWNLPKYTDRGICADKQHVGFCIYCTNPGILLK